MMAISTGQGIIQRSGYPIREQLSCQVSQILQVNTFWHFDGSRIQVAYSKMDGPKHVSEKKTEERE
jgi:hypothetical protein